jgi:hypothetical protein
MGFKITISGIDCTAYFDEMSIQATDVLGQGPGTSSVSAGRSATLQINTTLGPVSSASGAGTVISSPQLLRGAPILLYNASNVCIFGGYIGKIDDISTKKQVYSTVYAYDWYQELDRVQVQTFYSGVSDSFMIDDLLKTYAPWVDRSLLPAAGNYQFTAKVFKATSLQKAINAVTDITGWIFWIGPDQKAHYVSPANTQSAPFSLSDSPDFITRFNYGFNSLEIDDTSAINRVMFYGGKKLSNNFTQDLSTQANGSNTLFVLAYYPHACTDGKYHIRANGSGDLVIGYVSGSGAVNTLKSQGGVCDVLLNTDARTILFNAAPTNSGPNSVLAEYRYDYPMVVQVVDKSSLAFYGRYFDGVISDDTVFDTATAVARCRALLAEQSMGLTALKVRCWKAGLQSGQTLGVFNSVRGINKSYLIQEVDLVPLGAGNFAYDVTLGAWSWNLVDVLINATNAAFNAGLAPVNDNANGVSANAIQVEGGDESISAAMTLSTSTRQWGGYYARTSAVGDGHDAYSGLFSISS